MKRGMRGLRGGDFPTEVRGDYLLRRRERCEEGFREHGKSK